MHTFSPAKMWIAGLGGLQKPFLHLHTQFNDEIPWATIDMDFMNLNQAAHGDREFGFLAARLRLERTVVVGHWADASVQDRIGVWARAASARKDWLGGRIARFGDNMREVAVTEGDKLEAQRRLGFSVNSYGVGDLVARVDATSDADVDRLIEAYCDEYDVAPELAPGGERHGSLRDGARIELGLRSFLGDGAFIAFTDTFEDLHGLRQLPGLAVQRLMAEGYGFGAEGDWKTAAMVRAMKVMSAGLPGGTSFMEDYTYHFAPSGDRILGAHMLEVCPSIAAERPRLEVHPLSIGGKDDPVRLVFDAHPGPAILACVTDMGDRFRMVASVVDVVPPEQPLPAAASRAGDVDDRARICGRMPPPGSWRAARITPASATRSPRSTCATSPLPAGPSCSSSTRRPSSTASATGFAGTTSTTTSPRGCEDLRVRLSDPRR